MCLALFACRVHRTWDLVFLANRDEFYARPARPARHWEDAPRVLAGRDVTGGGTWLGVTATGRIAGLTNFRDPSAVRADAPSRGALVSNFLTGDRPAGDYVDEVAQNAGVYNPFNLLAGQGPDLIHYSNVTKRATAVTSGIHGLSNALLDTPWPKVTVGRQSLEQVLDRHQAGQADTEDLVEALFLILFDTRTAPLADLPSTGIPVEWEHKLSAPFIQTEEYGTRCSTVILMGGGRILFEERTFDGRVPRQGPVGVSRAEM